jgi:hypothetical protein
MSIANSLIDDLSTFFWSLLSLQRLLDIFDAHSRIFIKQKHINGVNTWGQLFRAQNVELDMAE